MDPIAIAFYALVCAVLSLFAPGLGGMAPRIAVGAAVGIAASVALPFVREMLAAGV